MQAAPLAFLGTQAAEATGLVSLKMMTSPPTVGSILPTVTLIAAKLTSVPTVQGVSPSRYKRGIYCKTLTLPVKSRPLKHILSIFTFLLFVIL